MSDWGKRLTVRDVLEMAIARAVDNGLTPPGAEWWKDKSREYKLSYCMPDNSYEELIFDHLFLKALFGEDKVEISIKDGHISSKCLNCNTNVELTGDVRVGKKSWEHHVQQMAIDPNPLEYIRKYIEETKK